MLQKNIFKNIIKDVILRYMLEDTVKPGERLSLPTIASELDVSVTPVREALTLLTETGIVTYKANRGFFVTELTEQEASEIYRIIALLEGEAIRNTEYDADQLLQLKEINNKFLKSKNAKSKLQLDKEFHQKLIENYSNQYAHKLIEDIRIRVFIYELKFMKTTSSDESFIMHENIIKYLEAGKISSAIRELNANWEISINHIRNVYQSKKQ